MLCVFRAIVEAPLYDVFVERVREKVAALTVGDQPRIQTSAPLSTERS